MAILTPFRHRFYDNAGLPLADGKVYTYAAGTTTMKASYTDSTGSVPNANPIILDSKGEANIWTSGLYKINVTTSADVQVTGWPVDNVGFDIFSSVFLSVKDFGAIGNGIADDTVAIQAALTANPSVIFPSGTYLISGSILPIANQMLKFENCTIKATGVATAYNQILTGGSSAPLGLYVMLDIKNGSRMSWAGSLTIDMSSIASLCGLAGSTMGTGGWTTDYGCRLRFIDSVAYGIYGQGSTTAIPGTFTGAAFEYTDFTNCVGDIYIGNDQDDLHFGSTRSNGMISLHNTDTVFTSLFKYNASLTTDGITVGVLSNLVIQHLFLEGAYRYPISVGQHASVRIKALMCSPNFQSSVDAAIFAFSDNCNILVDVSPMGQQSACSYVVSRPRNSTYNPPGRIEITCPYGLDVKTKVAVFTVTIAAPAVFSLIAHTLVADDKITFTTTGALPTGLQANLIYRVLAAGLTPDAFEVALSSGGTPIATTGTQSGVHTLTYRPSTQPLVYTTGTGSGTSPEIIIAKMSTGNFFGYFAGSVLNYVREDMRQGFANFYDHASVYLCRTTQEGTATVPVVTGGTYYIHQYFSNNLNLNSADAVATVYMGLGIYTGQRIRITNSNAANNITLGTSAGLLKLAAAGASYVLLPVGANAITLTWDGVNWNEESRIAY